MVGVAKFNWQSMVVSLALVVAMVSVMLPLGAIAALAAESTAGTNYSASDADVVRGVTTESQEAGNITLKESSSDHDSWSMIDQEVTLETPSNVEFAGKPTVKLNGEEILVTLDDSDTAHFDVAGTSDRDQVVISNLGLYVGSVSGSDINMSVDDPADITDVLTVDVANIKDGFIVAVADKNTLVDIGEDNQAVSTLTLAESTANTVDADDQITITCPDGVTWYEPPTVSVAADTGTAVTFDSNTGSLSSDRKTATWVVNTPNTTGSDTITLSAPKVNIDSSVTSGTDIEFTFACNNSDVAAVPSPAKVAEAIIKDEVKPIILSAIMPQLGTMVSETISLSVTATDTASGVFGVLLLEDGWIMDVDTSTPYSFDLDTGSFLNGEHVLELRVYDKAGNMDSISTTVTFSNPRLPAIMFDEGPEQYGWVGIDVFIDFESLDSPGTVNITAESSANPIDSNKYTLIGTPYRIELQPSSVNASGMTVLLVYYSRLLGEADQDSLRLLYWDSAGKIWSEYTYDNDNFSNNKESFFVGTVVSIPTTFALVKKVTNNGSGGSTGSSGGGGGNSSSSSSSSSSSTLTKPQDLKGSPGNGVINLTWSESKDSKFSEYHVYRVDGDGRSEKPSDSKPIATTKSAKYNDSSIEPGKYTYYVTAADGKGNESEPARVVVTYPAVKSQIIFSDISAGAWYGDYVSALVARNIAGGYPNGTFRPDNAVTRAEFAKMICLAMGWELVDNATPSFGDVHSSHWAYKYIETMKKHGVIGGYPNGTFGPGINITRAEIASIIAKALALSGEGTGSLIDLIDIDGSWAKAYIGACVKAGIINGYPNSTFKPNDYATRAEAAKVIINLMNSK